MPSIAQPGFRKLSCGQPRLSSTISPSFHFSAHTTGTTIFFLYLSTLYPLSAGGRARLGRELLPRLKPGQVLPAHAGFKTPASLRHDPAFLLVHDPAFLLSHDPSPSSVTIPPSFLVRLSRPTVRRIVCFLTCIAFACRQTPLSSLRRQAGNPEKPPCFPPAKKSESAYNQEEEKKAVSGRRHDVVQCGQRGFCFDGVFFARVKARLGSWLKGKQKSRSRPQRGQRWRLP